MSNNFFIPLNEPSKNIIHSIWQTNRSTQFQKEFILPKGVIEIIFNFSKYSKSEAQINNRVYLLADCFINGYNTFPIQLHHLEDQIIFGVRLQPIAVKNLFGIPPGEFANLPLDLCLIDSSVHSLWHQLRERNAFEERISIVSRWAEDRWLPASPQEQMLNWFLNERDQKIPDVTGLAKMLCYSPRNLSRKLHALTGMNTEEVLLYKKFLRSINLIHYTSMSLTQIAYSSQFADQSHFIKTFRSLAAITPGEYKNQKSVLPGHIFENVR
jgi:AraC-like DNA-binding protein